MNAERRTRGHALAAVLTLSACACASPEITLGELRIGTQQRFEATVQPQLIERCGSGGCHGRAQRAFSVYAPGAWRADPARTYLDEPLTAEESLENARHCASFALEDDPADSLLLSKPLDDSGGGYAHAGGPVFRNSGDPLYRALHDWLTERTATDAGAR